MGRPTHHEHKATLALFFDPDDHPEDTLKSFNEFIQVFELRYNAQYPDLPKVSLDAAIQRWKFTNATQANPDPKPTLAQYNQISAEWRSKDRVAKIIGMFTSSRLYTDWKAAEPDETIREDITWADFITKMRVYYKPTKNPTLQNFHFRALTQANNETFPAFCNRDEQEAKHCDFNCTHSDCTAKQAAVRDQIVIGTFSKVVG